MLSRVLHSAAQGGQLRGGVARDVGSVSIGPSKQGSGLLLLHLMFMLFLMF